MQHLDAESVASRYLLSPARLDDLVRLGRFPAPIKLGGRRLWTVTQLDAFDAAEIEKAAQIQAERQAAAPKVIAERQARAARKRASSSVGSDEAAIVNRASQKTQARARRTNESRKLWCPPRQGATA